MFTYLSPAPFNLLPFIPQEGKAYRRLMQTYFAHKGPKLQTWSYIWKVLDAKMSFTCQNSKLFGVYRFVWQRVAVLVNCESDARCNLKRSQKSCRYVSNFIWKTVREGEKKAPKTASWLLFAFIWWPLLLVNFRHFLPFFPLFPELVAQKAYSTVQKTVVSAWFINSKDSEIVAYLANLMMHEAKIEYILFFASCTIKANS